jgi:predicted glycosyltransferase
VYDHLPQDRLLSLIAGAKSLVCRSGYTTMMELAGLGKAGVLLVPTPGQPEQEFLAVHAQQAGLAFWQDQDALDLGEGLRRALAYPGFSGLFAARANAGYDLAGWVARHPLLTDVS